MTEAYAASPPNVRDASGTHSGAVGGGNAPLRLALYGRSGSGKSTAATFLARELGFAHCKTGAACRSIARELFGSEDKTVLNHLTDALREIDATVWLRAALRVVADDGGERPIVFDSMRFTTDYRYLRANGFTTVKIEAPTALRIRRLETRGQGFDPAVDDEHASETELAGEEFCFTIRNDGAVDDLYGQVADVVSEIRLQALASR